MLRIGRLVRAFPISLCSTKSSCGRRRTDTRARDSASSCTFLHIGCIVVVQFAAVWCLYKVMDLSAALLCWRKFARGGCMRQLLVITSVLLTSPILNSQTPPAPQTARQAL